MKVRVEIPDRAPSRRDEDGSRTALAVQELEASPGRPLPEELRREMEARFGCDFSEVRIHQDARADGSARALGARAFTIGNDIYFQAGAFEPAKLDGRRLLAHELAHTIQQAQAAERVPKPTAKIALESLTARRAEERKARDAAEIALSGERLRAGGIQPARGAAAGLGPASAATAGLGPASAAAAGQAAPHVARWVDTIPQDRASSSPANPFVEELALDVAHALQRDPADAGAHSQRRLSRLEAATRAAVIARVQEMLTPDQRELSAKALSGAAVTEDEPSTEGRRAPEGAHSEDQGQQVTGAEVEQPVPATAQPIIPAADGPAHAAAAHAERSARHAREAAAAGSKAGAIKGVHDRAARLPAGKAPAPADVKAVKPGGETQLATAAGAMIAPEGAPQGPAGKLGAPGAAGGSPGAGAAQGDGGGADAQPDLGPADALEAKVDAKTRERIARAEKKGEELGKKQAAEAGPARAAAPSAHAAAAIAAKQPEQSAAEVAAEAEADAEARDALESVAAQEPSGAAEPEPAGAPQPEPAVAPEMEPAVAPETGGSVVEPTVTVGYSDHPPAEPAAEPEPTAEVEADVGAEPAGDEPDADPTAGAEPAGDAADVEPSAPEPTAAVDATRAAESVVLPPAEPAPAAPIVPHEPEAASDSADAITAEASAAERDEAPAGDVTAAVSEPEPAVSEPAEPETPAERAADADTSATGAETPGAETPGAEEPAAEMTDGADETEPAAAEAPAGGDGGGDCGPDSPPGVGGGGGGGAPIEDPQPEPEPDVSQAEPEAAMATVATLPPGPAQRTLHGVQAASNRAVADKRDDLTANPPSLERPTGSPQTRGDGPGGPRGAAGTISKGGRVARAHGKGKTAKTVPPPLPPAPPSPVQAVRPRPSPATRRRR